MSDWLETSRKTAALDITHRPLSETWFKESSASEARRNTRALGAYTKEIAARVHYAEELRKLFNATVERDRAVARFVDRDELIADDRAQLRHELGLNKLRRLREAEAAFAALYESERLMARAAWGRDAFLRSRPHREERLDHLYKTGALDAEINMLVADERKSEFGASAPQHTPGDTHAEILEALEQEIELSRARHASAEVIDAFEALRARIGAAHEVQKNRPR